MPVNLLNFSPRQLARYCESLSEKPYRAQQLMRWIYQRGEDDFSRMTDLKAELRAQLKETAVIVPPQVREDDMASDGTRKWLLQVDAVNAVETVFIPEESRGTLCVSSQAGCALACTFCSTGRQGFARNLTTGEIVGQLWSANKSLCGENSKIHYHSGERIITNVVFMGMGEPLLNLENLVPTLDILYKSISPKRVTVSTSGIIPGLEDLARLARRPNLAISINAPDRKRREEIMPITKKYPLEDLMAALRRFPLEKGRDMTIEYVLLAGYNDSPQDARMLAKVIGGLHAKVNAIPFNEDPNLPAWMKRPNEAAIDRFVDTLVQSGVRVTVRRSKGREIAAACGQLRGKTEARSRASRQRDIAERRVDRAAGVKPARIERDRVHRERR